MSAVATAGGLPNKLGKFELLMPLASGGMARIYIGRTTGIGSFERHVVLKLILPERANDAVAVQMFLDEARLAASLNHQNVAQVFEVGEDGGIHYLAMEYVHGQDLRALLAKAGGQGTRVPLDLALTVVSGAAAGLNHAHERRGADGVGLGIVHRDVSPSNIMVGYDGSVKLLDFGIAKATQRSVETQSGIIKGKFAYMAPEQCRGRDVDRRSDVFSLGIILYEITTQHRCFRADSDFDTMHRIVTGDVVKPSRLVQGYPPALEAIVMKALAVDAASRYQSAGALLEAVEQFSVDSRMSLSTMALGRFMREMFGEHTEPWLNTTGKYSQPALTPPRESTISNTNGSESAAALPPTLPVEPVIARHDSAPVPAPRTLLDLPRGQGEDDHHDHQDGSDAEWNAKSYPTMQPVYASAATLPPEAVGRSSSSNMSMPRDATPMPMVSGMVGGQGGPGGPGGMMSGIPGVQVAQPSNVPPAAFPVPGTGSGRAIGTTPIASTRHGYASAPGTTRSDSQLGGAAYPVYEPQIHGQIRQSRRWLFAGIGAGVLGMVVVLGVVFGGGGGGDRETGIVPPAATDDSHTVVTPGSNGSGDSVTPTAGSAAVSATAPDGSGSAIAPTAPTTGSAVAPTQPSTNGSAVAPATTGSAAATAAGSNAAIVAPAVGSAGSAAPTPITPPPADDLVALHVTSDPDGAEVLLAGKRLGVTPLDMKVKRSVGATTIVLHHARYADSTVKVDFDTDVTRSITLHRPDAAPTTPPHDNTPTTPKHDPTTTTTPKHTSKVDCQPRNAVNPFDARPVCK